MGEGTQTVESREPCLWPGANSTSQARGRQLSICSGIQGTQLPELIIQLSAASALGIIKVWFPGVFCSMPRGGSELERIGGRWQRDRE